MPDAPTPQPFTANARRRVPRWVWFVLVCVALGAMTSVGVAWGIAWRHDPFLLSGNPETGSAKPKDDSDRPLPFAWDFERWTFGSLVENSFWAMPFEKAQHRARVTREKHGVDEAAAFADLSSDAASQRALHRHLPLIRGEDGQYVSFSVKLIGWPFLALAHENACTLNDALAEKRHMYFSSGPTGATTRVPNPQATITDPAFNLLPHYSAIKIGDKYLPTFPLWPGLLANTAIYGGAWAVLIGAPILLRRWLRARRGGCPQCGYSREGLKEGTPCPECGRTNATIASSTSTSTTSESHDGPSRPEGPRDLSHD